MVNGCARDLRIASGRSPEVGRLLLYPLDTRFRRHRGIRVRGGSAEGAGCDAAVVRHYSSQAGRRDISDAAGNALNCRRADAARVVGLLLHPRPLPTLTSVSLFIDGGHRGRTEPSWAGGVLPLREHACAESLPQYTLVPQGVQRRVGFEHSTHSTLHLCCQQHVLTSLWRVAASSSYDHPIFTGRTQ